MIKIRHALLVVVAAFLTWRIAAYGISEYYRGQAALGDTSALDRALAWNSRQPDALYRKAEAIRETDPAGSSSLLRQAFVQNPASSFPLLALAREAQDAGNEAQASALVGKSSELMPANPPIQVAAGGYWAARGNLEAAMMHWSQALDASRSTSDELFPILLKLAEEPRAVGLFKSLAESPPSWWEDFFKEVAKRALDPETVRALYAFRRASTDAPLTREERNRYVRRLRREGKTTEAYLVWVNGLDEEEQAQLGILNNGSFEVEPTNTGFDWHLAATDRAVASTGITGGVEGTKALRLLFKGREKRYGHVHQPLFLDPGAYRVRGMVRTDSLNSKGGLKWVVRCVRPERAELGESERFLGSGEWREFAFVVRVPVECEAQEIRLVSAGTRMFEYKTTGGVWFDGISMRKVLIQSADAAASSTTHTPEGVAIEPGMAPQFNVQEGEGAPVFDFSPTLIESLRDGDD